LIKQQAVAKSAFIQSLLRKGYIAIAIVEKDRLIKAFLTYIKDKEWLETGIRIRAELVV
jgi:hypothetical protein